jgi:hypothetical protein
MTCSLLPGVRAWSGGRDDEGNREFKVIHLVKSNAPRLDGPYSVMNCAGLPAIGDIWSFGNDNDIWAFCWPTMVISPHETKEGEGVKIWKVEQKFSTKPIPSRRCQDETITDPLLEPQKVSGSFVKYTKEAVVDRFNNLIKNSAHEMLRGPQVEFDHNKPTVKIEQNVSVLGLETFAEMVDTVNMYPMWGLPVRCVKLSNVSWERKTYGVCSYYYTRSFDFDIDYNTFDRCVLDEGTKILIGQWSKTDDSWVVATINGVSANPDNPMHFMRYKDRNCENTKIILDGSGLPAGIAVTITKPNVTDSGVHPSVGTSSGPGTIGIQYYGESDLFSLGIPTDF